MRLSISSGLLLLDTLARRLNGGELVIYAGQRPLTTDTVTFQDALVRIPFDSPAFAPAVSDVPSITVKAVAHDLPPTVIAVSGEARWAQSLTANGEIVSDGWVGVLEDGRRMEDLDIVVDRTDFQRGGLCTLTLVTLTLPLDECE